MIPGRERRKRKRERIAIVLIAVAFLALTIAEFRLSKVSSTLPFVNSIFFFGLLNLNLILLIGLVWLVFRNIGKLFLERRSRKLGARLKSKLVLAFLGFSVTPTLVLFVISSMYINSSFDKWFSIKVQNTLQASLEITQTYYRNAKSTAMHFAEHLAGQLGRKLPAGVLPAPAPWIQGYLESQRDLLALHAVEFYSDPLDERVVVSHPHSKDLPYAYPRLPLDVLDKAFAGEAVSIIQHVGTGDLLRCMVPVHSARGGPTVAGVIAVSTYVPVSLVNKVDAIASVFDDYQDTNPLKYPIKTTYFVILVMITLVILFVAIWMGLYLARELTVPVERLVKGAQEVGAGNLDISIERTGNDELAVLIDSFNKMTRDLKEHRERLEQAGADLESRRLQLEAVLANIGTGVLVVNRAGEITTFNRAASQLVGLTADRALGRKYSELLPGREGPLTEVIDRAFTQAHDAGETKAEVTQWNAKTGDALRSLAAIATPLHDENGTWGVVTVIDDMSHLIKAQREMAWREVARRIAHEIKNPLTPIKLSAQRLQRRMGHFRGREADLLKECTDTIVRHTDELKEMVNEFSNFARLPQASPAPHDLNEVAGEVVKLYSQAHPNVSFRTKFEARLPIFQFDRDQIKRVIINLLDNAISALKGIAVGRAPAIGLRTHFNEQLQMAVIEVEDNGPGMTDEIMARVFEPYFSTKAEGTGLGLAIAKRIVNDHDGFIRVHSTPENGTKFLIELPTAVKQDLERRAEA